MVHKLSFAVGVRAILQDSGGNYWFGSHGEGICRYDGEEFEYFTTKDGLAGNHILSIQEDSKGTIWVDTQQGVTGVWRYDGDSLVNFTIDEKLESQMIWDIHEDHRQNLLFATAQGGVYQFNGNTFDRRF